MVYLSTTLQSSTLLYICMNIFVENRKDNFDNSKDNFDSSKDNFIYIGLAIITTPIQMQIII